MTDKLAEAARSIRETWVARPDIRAMLGPKEYAQLDALGAALDEHSQPQAERQVVPHSGAASGHDKARAPSVAGGAAPLSEEEDDVDAKLEALAKLALEYKAQLDTAHARIAELDRECDGFMREVAELRARIAELERERDDWKAEALRYAQRGDALQAQLAERDRIADALIEAAEDVERIARDTVRNICPNAWYSEELRDGADCDYPDCRDSMCAFWQRGDKIKGAIAQARAEGAAARDRIGQEALERIEAAAERTDLPIWDGSGKTVATICIRRDKLIEILGNARRPACRSR